MKNRERFLGGQTNLLALSIWVLGGFLDPAAAQADGLDFSMEERVGGGVEVQVFDYALETPVIGATVTLVDRNSSASLSEADRQMTDRWGYARVESSGRALHQDLVVSASGYAVFALAGVKDGRVRVSLRPLAEPRSEVVLSGRVGGWAGRDGRDSVQMGFAFRALGVSDLVQLNLNSMISPLHDTIDLFGQRKIPSNLVFPEQRVSLPLGSLRLNKPDYRLPVFQGEGLQLALVQGEAKSGDLLNLLVGGGKQVDSSVLNLIKMKKIGFARVSSPNSTVKQNIDGTVALTAVQTVTTAVAPFSASIVVASAIDFTGDRDELIPTDVKSAAEEGKAPKPVRLASATGVGAERVVAAAAVSDRGKRISGIAQSTASDRIILGAFRTVHEYPDFDQLPRQVELRPFAEGLVQLTAQMKLPKDSEGKPRVGGVIAVVYALPDSGASQLDLAGLGLPAEVGRYVVSDLEFDANRFHPGRIDGRTELRGLKRFTRSMATYR